MRYVQWSLIISILLFLTTDLASAYPQLMQAYTIQHNGIMVQAAPELHRAFLREPFFAYYDPQINFAQLAPTIQIIPFIMSIAPVVWFSGNTYTIDVMDEDTFYALEKVHTVFRAFFPWSSWQGHIIPQSLIKNRHAATTTAATLFSGGLDAIYTVIRNRPTPQLLITCWGGDVPLTNYTMWKQIARNNKQFAYKHGHAWSFVRSNFGTYIDQEKIQHHLPAPLKPLNWWGQTSQALQYVGLATPLAVAKGCSKLFIASTNTAWCPYPYGSHPCIDNLLHCAGIPVVHDGAEATRIDKIIHLKQLCTTHNLPTPTLRVCWGKDKEGKNCLHCEKCLRTVLELWMAGEDPHTYGFAISPTQAATRARQRTPNQWQADQALWHWLCIAQRASEIATLDPALADFCAWFRAQRFNVERYVHIRYFPQVTEIYRWLWNKALEGKFTSQDVHHLPSIQGEPI